MFVQTFTQSQCYGEFHCFHARLTPDQFVEIHVGAPTPNRQHSCLKPSFDPDLPYLLATLIPTSHHIEPMTTTLATTAMIMESDNVQDEKEENLDKIGQHAMKLVQQYQSEFSNRIQQWIGQFISQVKLLMLH